ncbi:chitin synthase 1 [Tremella mesenterica]|uniref:chitin synthase n=1 Tax=Tremella mesenterica TaxID=5217 RepID=A0A4Q1BTT8_TREME|nr:chitin synthase 1 [Tremella mesenterica]
MPTEASDKKPGNRGKRDSQLILMNFFSRVTYNDRMSPLDFDMFRKIQTLIGVTPDFFELVLMVDADTKVYPDSLKHLVNAMHHDNSIMGVCGETRIANKRQSWVTAIQVYEYFISHHLVKAFESVFGGVTCLPGCFSMYRIKARKDADDDWVPILVKPEIVREYSQSEVTTLHQKNLLLLGEDRFLSTIMLRTFPKRKNIFLPQAKCRTVAPDTFSVLLSQRRRWINSTVHNLMELVRVRNLCGIFCFSMQFVVFMDLVGTVVLPVAICLTFALIVNSIITPPTSFQEAIPLMLLAAVLGLPAILILITTRKVIYVAWMMAYLVALPIWNFVLPIYAFWHFDDFSWGETRRVEGELRRETTNDKTAIFDGTTIPLRRWEDWEKSRLRKMRREEKRRKEMEKQFGSKGFYQSNNGNSNVGQDGLLGTGTGEDSLDAPRAHWIDSQYGSGSDTNSLFSSDEDVWGGEIGGYNEHNPAFPPPPISLAPVPLHVTPDGVFGEDEMAAILDQGFDDGPRGMGGGGVRVGVGVGPGGLSYPPLASLGVRGYASPSTSKQLDKYGRYDPNAVRQDVNGRYDPIAVRQDTNGRYGQDTNGKYGQNSSTQDTNGRNVHNTNLGDTYGRHNMDQRGYTEDNGIGSGSGYGVGTQVMGQKKYQLSDKVDRSDRRVEGHNDSESNRREELNKRGEERYKDKSSPPWQNINVGSGYKDKSSPPWQHVNVGSGGWEGEEPLGSGKGWEGEQDRLNSGNSISSSIEPNDSRGHVKRRSGGKEKYGPLGPLEDGWGRI